MKLIKMSFSITQRCMTSWRNSPKFSRNCCSKGAFIVLNILIFASSLTLYAFHYTKWTSGQTLEAIFACPLTTEDKISLMRTFETFHNAMTANNLTYVIHAGSLLGSYRHHDRIPWDDDVDVLMNSSQKNDIRRVLLGLSPTYRVLSLANDVRHHWRFYPSDGHHLVHRSFRSPFMDLFFFRENETHIWAETPRIAHERMPKNSVFPLQLRPFGHLMVPTPCDTQKVLGILFDDLSLCETRKHSHLYSVSMVFPPTSVSCDELKHIYPFVRKRDQEETATNAQKVHSVVGLRKVVETLVFQNWMLQNVTVTVC